MATPIIIESRYFEEKVKRKGFFQKWNDIEKPKKELAKVQVVQANGSSWVKLAQVGQVEQVEAGLQVYVGQVGQELLARGSSDRRGTSGSRTRGLSS